MTTFMQITLVLRTEWPWQIYRRWTLQGIQHTKPVPMFPKIFFWSVWWGFFYYFTFTYLMKYTRLTTNCHYNDDEEWNLFVCTLLWRLPQIYTSSSCSLLNNWVSFHHSLAYCYRRTFASYASFVVEFIIRLWF